jgi:Na+/proline symporter
MQQNTPCATWTNIEGFDLVQTALNAEKMPLITSECGNLHLLYRLLLNKDMPHMLLYALEFGSMAILLAAYFLYHRSKRTYSLLNAALMGFCLMMVLDLCTLINRHQYNTVQWLFPLLLLPIIERTRETRVWVMVILTGYLLNILDVPFLKMEHSVGEYMMLLGFTILSLKIGTKLSSIEKALPKTVFSPAASATQSQGPQ